MRVYHIRSRTPWLWPTALLAALLLPTGCHQAPDTDSGPSPLAALHSTSDTPTSFPATPALFATAAVLATPPTPQVAYAPLPPPPSNADQVAQQAVSADAAPAGAAPTDAGLIVCDPVAGSPELSTFGSGCGRWLDLVAAGQPELGRTPFWEARERAQHEMGRTDFCLAPSQAVALSVITGATHAACGTISGTPTHCTLTYGLYRLPGGKPVGSPLTRSGSEAQILAALPDMAKALDTRLGVPAPRVPVSVGLSPAEVVQYKTIHQEDYPSEADLSTLARLSARSPVAGMDYLSSRAANDQFLLTGMVRTLQTQLPGNALVLAHIGYERATALRPSAAAIRALFARFPASALFAHTDVWQQRIWGTRAGELAASQRVTRDAPDDPDSWLTLGYTLSSVAEDLRQSRVAGDISEAEWASLRLLYPRWEDATLRATTLDPQDGHAWARLAQAATFAGDTNQAKDALQKALVLDADKAEVYEWGLEMYQPKWGGDPVMLNKIAALAAAEPWNDSRPATSMAASLRSAKLDALADGVLSGFITRERMEIAKAPSDALLHWDLAAALSAQNTRSSLRESSLEYRLAAHLMPDAPEIHHWLGDVLDQRDRTAEAVVEYRKAVALDPFSADAHFSLGYDLKHEHQFPEALSEMRLAMRLDPHNAATHYGLGDLLTMQHQYKPAVGEFREAIRMRYYMLDARTALIGALDESGQYDSSLGVGRETDRLLTELERASAETELPVHNTMADDYLHKKEWASSIAESRVSLGYDPNDAWAHENLAEAYIGKGDKAQARAEWMKTIALGNPALTPTARKLLAAHP